MTKDTYTKEFIINHLKKYYKENNTIPSSKSNDYPFSSKTVQNKFGSWSAALLNAEIPLRINKPIEVICTNCDKIYIKRLCQIKKCNNNFCSRSCSASYTNKHRKSGNNISKLEAFLQKELKGFDFIFNDRKICDGYELDIYLPKLHLAFEINGIFHYKPIFGMEKLQNTQRKDILKNKICVDKNIKLITIVDESPRFSLEHGEFILNKVYKFIHNINYKNVLSQIPLV
jgi:hypothetical protein